MRLTKEMIERRLSVGMPAEYPCRGPCHQYQMSPSTEHVAGEHLFAVDLADGLLLDSVDAEVTFQSKEMLGSLCPPHVERLHDERPED